MSQRKTPRIDPDSCRWNPLRQGPPCPCCAGTGRWPDLDLAGPRQQAHDLLRRFQGQGLKVKAIARAYRISCWKVSIVLADPFRQAGLPRTVPRLQDFEVLFDKLRVLADQAGLDSAFRAGLESAEAAARQSQ